MPPKIILSPEVAINLENLVNVTRGQEFSGLGFCNVIEGDIHVYDVVLLDVGSTGYTEISTEKLMAIKRPDKVNIRLWFHRHPIEGWSSTDTNTIVTAPLGGIPEIVRWSASIVRTPTKWIGRVDDHLNKVSVVAEVLPNVSAELSLQALDLLHKYYERTEGPAKTTHFPFYPGTPEEYLLQTSFLDEEDDFEDEDDEILYYEDDEFECVDDDQIVYYNSPEYHKGRRASHGLAGGF